MATTKTKPKSVTRVTRIPASTVALAKSVISLAKKQDATKKPATKKTAPKPSPRKK